MAWNKDPEGLIVHHDGDQLLREVRTTQACKLGGRLEFFDGRKYRYCSTNNDLTIGMMVQSTLNLQAIAATYFGVDSSTAPAADGGGAIGDTEIDFTTDVTGITADEFAGGYLIISDGTGAGQCVKVRGNDASPSSGHAHIYLYRNDALGIALDNTSVGKLIGSPYADTDIADNVAAGAVQTSFIVGRAAATTTAGTDTTNEFLWVQTHGIGALISDDGVSGIGQQCGIAVDDEGSVEALVDASATAAFEHQHLAVAMDTPVNLKVFPAVLVPQGL